MKIVIALCAVLVMVVCIRAWLLLNDLQAQLLDMAQLNNRHRKMLEKAVRCLNQERGDA